MSTRSGKQIHSSFHGNFEADKELVVMSERKTKNTRSKENKHDFGVILFNPKKRINYVCYPTDDENLVDGHDTCDTEIKHTRLTRRHALKEQNIDDPQTYNLETSNTTKKQVRVTRRTKKLTDNDLEIEKHHESVDKQESMLVQKVKTKKTKKNKILDMEEVDNVANPVIVKKKLKKKKRKSSSLVSEEENLTDNLQMSKESFHSACYSLVDNESGNNNTNTEMCNNILSEFEVTDCKIIKTHDKYNKCTNKEQFEIRDKIDMDKSLTESSDSFLFHHGSDLNNELDIQNSCINKNILDKQVSDNEICGSSKKRKSLVTKTCEKENVLRTPDNLKFNEKRSLENSINKKNSTSHKKMDITSEKEHNSMLSSSGTKRKSIIINTTFEKDIQQYHKSPEVSKRNNSHREDLIFNQDNLYTPKNLNSTFEIENDIFSLFTGERNSGLMNRTFEKEAKITPESLKSTGKRNSSVRKKNNGGNTNYYSNIPETLDNTFELKNPKESSVNSKSLLDKSMTKSLNISCSGKYKKVNTTFEKDSNTSLISSDESNCQDNSRITITSDESIDQDLNKTPNDHLFNETSDDSNLDENKSPDHVSSKEVIMNTTPFLIESSLDETILNSSKTSEKEPVTPLKREGTFTKDCSDVLVSNPAMGSSPKVTPNKCIPLPSPGCTPFPARSSQKGQFILNVTRSLEKITNSPFAESVQRATRVMFCSPIHNPALATQQKCKVIKSSLKGSNKSFLFQESDSPARTGPRKRSYTQNDAEYASAKRKRLTEDMQLSVERLSRPRTTSATAKLSESTTPSKKEFTPSKDKTGGKVSRTKLPNFAALHQKQFAKMESLDECQERKAKRARQLLSPVTTTITTTTKNPLKESQKDIQKPTRESTKKLDFGMKPSTLPSQRSGYTRFGYKLNLDVNPFSIPNKNTDETTEDTKPKGPVREATMPSISGATSVRREEAKQAILRGKSLTHKTSAKRNETRSIIKGVRTNRRFELQMKLRNLQ